MKLGMVGLGRMGAGLTQRAREGGHDVIGYDADTALTETVSLADLAAALAPPRAPARDTRRARWLRLCGSGGRGPLRKNGPQRHRVRVDAGLRGGLRPAPDLCLPARPCAIARLWGQGSVVRSWLLELTARALDGDPGLERVRAYAEDSGEGRWAVRESVAQAVGAPAIDGALYQRFTSRREEPFAMRLGQRSASSSAGTL